MKNTSKGRKPATLAPLSVAGVLSQILRYNDNPITFRSIGGVQMVDATQMAKPFGKHPHNWLRLPKTRAFISEFQREKKLSIVFSSAKGGRGSGTYLHEDIAIEFALWLSPAYAIWCNDRIKELLCQGVTLQHPQEQPRISTLNDALVALRESTDLIMALKTERAERERLEAVLSSIKRLIDGLPSKAKFYNDTQIQLFKTR